jgi:hypothetical protein
VHHPETLASAKRGVNNSFGIPMQEYTKPE